MDFVHLETDYQKSMRGGPHECDNMGDDSRKYTECMQLLGTYQKGGEPLCFDPEYGVRMGGEAFKRFYIEVHNIIKINYIHPTSHSSVASMAAPSTHHS